MAEAWKWEGGRHREKLRESQQGKLWYRGEWRHTGYKQRMMAGPLDVEPGLCQAPWQSGKGIRQENRCTLSGLAADQSGKGKGAIATVQQRERGGLNQR